MDYVNFRLQKIDVSFVFFIFNKMSRREIGAPNGATSLSALITNSSATGESMTGLAHDPINLSNMMKQYMDIQTPHRFASAVALKSQIFQQIDRVYDCPFSCAVVTTIPVAMDFVQSSVRSGNGTTAFEFNVMRTVDFIGRNYLMITLPRIDCSEIKDASGSSISDPKHCYLGAWHRDLVPRIINSVSFYSRANNHVLFEYSGYDIYIFNSLFGNAQKELNDIMAGEDKFELCYDPYYVNGAALGLASIKGIDPFEGYAVDNASGTVSAADVVGCLQIDNCMDKAEFREFYRRGVWFETPYMKGRGSRHSIHSRRLIHNSKTLWIPLYILPFGYSIASAIPIGAVHGDVGYIHLDIFQNWLDRSFYVTKLSDIPIICPMPQHTHYEQGDVVNGDDTIGPKDPRLGWVIPGSVGKLSDPKYQKRGSVSTTDAEVVVEGAVESTNFGAIVGQGAATELSANHRSVAVPTASGSMGAYAMGSEGYLAIPGQDAQYKSLFGKVPTVYKKADLQEEIDTFIWPLSKISPSYYEQIKNQLEVSLIQVGYKTLACVRDLINKLPSIYITTEWSDYSVVPNARSHIEVLNDLYIEGIVLMFIPEDSNGIESIRMYPNHYIDHELDVINKIRISNENGQGVSIYTWQMLNAVVPSVLNLQNTLIENMGIIPFSPRLASNEFPHAFYDTNVNGQLRLDILPFEGESAISSSNITVNMKRGRILIAPIGINGLALANLTFYRIIY